MTTSVILLRTQQTLSPGQGAVREHQPALQGRWQGAECDSTLWGLSVLWGRYYRHTNMHATRQDVIKAPRMPGGRVVHTGGSGEESGWHHERGGIGIAPPRRGWI